MLNIGYYQSSQLALCQDRRLEYNKSLILRSMTHEHRMQVGPISTQYD
jgi:hypothetical protein